MIYLVRHGQTDWNLEKKTQGHTDIPLNDFGKEQASLVSKIIENFDIDMIISSDLCRAKETAQIINKVKNVEILLDDRLREICYGDLEGISRTTISLETWDIFNSNPEKFNAESMEKVYVRIKSLFDELDYSKNILIVTHGGALRTIMYYISNNEFFDKQKYNNEFLNKKIGNASIYKWDKNNNIFEPMDVN